MIREFKVGDKVVVTPQVNHVWAGRGTVKEILTNAILITMNSGSMIGSTGAFRPNVLKFAKPRHPDTIEVAQDLRQKLDNFKYADGSQRGLLAAIGETLIVLLERA